MIILHAGYAGDNLHLWGEIPLLDRELPPPTVIKKSRGRIKLLSVEPYPYDAGFENLLSALTTIFPGVSFNSLDGIQRLIWVPEDDGQPIPSSPLINQILWETPSSLPKLSIRRVTTIEWFIGDSIDLLSKCIGRVELAPGIIIGDDLKWWSKVLQFACTLIAHGRFIPALIKQGDDFFAKWEAVYSGDDNFKLTTLSRSTPHVARAIIENNRESIARSPDIILKSFLNAVVDYLVRDDDDRTPFLYDKQELSSIHDQWIQALLLDNRYRGLINSYESEIIDLQKTIRTWRRPIDITLGSPFRLCFRLEEPASMKHGGSDNEFLSIDINKTKKWHVSYLLQATDDPSLIIPVKDAWKPKKKIADIFKSRSFNPYEYLLSSLVQASLIDNDVEDSLSKATPSGYSTDVDGAYRFLTDKAQLLEQSGFPVMFPAWWARSTKQKVKVKSKVKSPKMQGGGFISLENIIEFDWEIAIDDQTLTIDELETLAAIKLPLIKMRGQWVHLSQKEIQGLVEFKRKKANKASLRDIIQMSFGRYHLSDNFDFLGVEAEGWIDDLLGTLSGRKSFEELSQPKNLNAILRPYQVRGYSWLSFLRQTGLGACLADDMGLGKSIQALSLILNDRVINNGHPPVLLICPMSVIGNWQKEISRFAPDLSVVVHHGSKRIKGPEFTNAIDKCDIVISSYSLLQRDFDTMREVKWSGIILDEAQNIKNPETKQSRAARNLIGEFRIALTGTPVENNVGDLWSIMEFLNPGFLGSQAEFKRNFFIPIQVEQNERAINGLKRLTEPFILRRLKTDKSIISDLPDKMEMKVYCLLTKEQASLYAAIVKDTEKLLEEAQGIERRGIILATLVKLKQVCNHPAQFLGDNSKFAARSGKLTRLSEMLDEALQGGDKVLIFTQFAEMGKIIQSQLQEEFDREVLFLHGAVQKKHRDIMVERFQSNDTDSPKIFLLSLKAGGTGLNLTAASHVFHFDRWWNPSVESQATDRAFRIGQSRNVQVHKFICAGTLEDKIDEMLEYKLQLSSKIVGTGEGWLTELSNDQLKELFILRKDAIAQ